MMNNNNNNNNRDDDDDDAKKDSTDTSVPAAVKTDEVADTSAKKKADTISTTAKVMATVRWFETDRKDVNNGGGLPRLFKDPLSAVLAGPEALERLDYKVKNIPNYPTAVRSFTIRTRFHDDAITDHLGGNDGEGDGTSGARAIDQIVLLGAGLDTRAYRLDGLDKEKTVIWEIDTPEIFEYKEPLLDEHVPKCRRVTIATNFQTSASEWVEQLLTCPTTNSENTGGGDSDNNSPVKFDPTRPTIWILEGLIYYLDPSAVEDLFSHISRLSCTGSVLALDMMSQASTDDSSQSWNSMWKFGCDDPVSFLQQHGGWTRNVKCQTPIQAARRYPGYDQPGVFLPKEEEKDRLQQKEEYWFVVARKE